MESNLLALDGKRTTVFDERFKYFFILTEEDDFIKLLIEGITSNVFYDSRESFIFSQHLEVYGIVGREIFVFWFNAY